MIMAMNGASGACRRVLCIVFLSALPTWAQSASTSAVQSGQGEVDAKIRVLTESLERTEAELSESRSEIRQLRAAFEQLQQNMEELSRSRPAALGQTIPQAENPPRDSQQAPPREYAAPAAASADDWEILNTRVEEQQQVKVESASKYRLKLSGLLLLNVFSTSGQVDNLDLPGMALPRSAGASEGSVGGSLRQSIVGLTGIGPQILGARTMADLQMDFFGGLPNGYSAAASGVMRLRLARVRFDWKNTSVTGGLDLPFFSPNSPTSYMSVAVPGFATAGNLWAWAPTIRVEQNLSSSFSRIKLEAGLLDSPGGLSFNATTRYPTAGESSRQPAYAVRISANAKSADHPYSIGFGGIYIPQRYFGSSKLNGWGGTMDWKFPLLPRTELSGEFFTGKGLDDFGGVAFPPTELESPGQPPAFGDSMVAGITMIGGWSQLKVKPDARNEFNIAAGSGGWNSGRLRRAILFDPALGILPARNQMFFVNYIFKPRSDLLFSAEYRRLRTISATGPLTTAGQVGFATGFLF